MCDLKERRNFEKTQLTCCVVEQQVLAKSKSRPGSHFNFEFGGLKRSVPYAGFEFSAANRHSLLQLHFVDAMHFFGTCMGISTVC